MRRNLSLLLVTVRAQIREYFIPTFRRFRVTEQQWRIIRTLNERREMGIVELADACLILRPSVVGIISRMEELGLLRRKADGNDGRRALISLTAKGQSLVDKVMPIIGDTYERLEGILGKSKLDQLYLILDDVTAQLDAHKRAKHPSRKYSSRGKAEGERSTAN